MKKFKILKWPLIKYLRATKSSCTVIACSRLFQKRKLMWGFFTYIHSQGQFEVYEYAGISSHCSVYSVSKIENNKV